MQKSVKGTVLYMAPEGLNNKGLNHKSDIW